MVIKKSDDASESRRVTFRVSKEKDPETFAFLSDLSNTRLNQLAAILVTQYVKSMKRGEVFSPSTALIMSPNVGLPDHEVVRTHPKTTFESPVSAVSEAVIALETPPEAEPETPQKATALQITPPEPVITTPPTPVIEPQIVAEPARPTIDITSPRPSAPPGSHHQGSGQIAHRLPGTNPKKRNNWMQTDEKAAENAN